MKDKGELRVFNLFAEGIEELKSLFEIHQPCGKKLH